MNNIYVDELPKSCDECKLGYFYDCQYCFLRPDLAEKDEWCKKEKHCKLLPLTDRLAEERKKVVQEFKEKVIDGTSCEILPTGDICITLEKINNVLDQIERGEIK